MRNLDLENYQENSILGKTECKEVQIDIKENKSLGT